MYMTKNNVVYQHISPNGKRYIGITDDIESRWRRDGSGYRLSPVFWNAIQKYGWDNFQHEVLIGGLTRKEAEEMERYLIREWQTKAKEFGYNLADGGTGGRTHNWSEESREKLRSSQQGKNNIFSEDDIREIKMAIALDIDSDELMDIFNLEKSTLSKITRLSNWGYIAPELNDLNFNRVERYKLERSKNVYKDILAGLSLRKALIKHSVSQKVYVRFKESNFK